MSHRLPPRVALLAALAYVGLIWSGGCREESSESSTKRQPQQPVATLTDATAKMAEAPPHPVLIEPSAVEAFLNTWLEAQNEGDFERYHTLYADNFTGVKRIAARVRNYDLAGWKADRSIMFESPMNVTATQVDIQTSVHTAVIRFIQSWAQNDFKDVGPKILVLTRKPAGRGDSTGIAHSRGSDLHIAREEMLYSTVLSISDTAETPVPERFGFVLAVGAERYVVLSKETDEAWGDGPPSLINKERYYTARRAVRVDMLPAVLAQSGTRRYLIAGNPKCEATISELVLLGGSVPHSVMLAAWTGGGLDPALPATPTDDDGIAAEMWLMSKPVLAGRLTLPAGCDGGWAHRVDIDDSPQPLAEVTLSAVQAMQFMIAFRQLSGYREIAQKFEAAGLRGHWEYYQGATPRLIGFSRPGGGTIVIVRSDAGSPCSRWRGELWAAWDVAPGGGQTLITPDGVSAYFKPHGALDLERDGIVELFGATRSDEFDVSLLRLERHQYRAIANFSWPDFNGPC